MAVDVDECQDCEDAPATHVAQMTIGGIPVGPLYVCEDCYPGDRQLSDTGGGDDVGD